MLANAEGICQAICATLPAAWNLVELSYAATSFGTYAAAASPSISSFFTKPHGPRVRHMSSADCPGPATSDAGQLPSVEPCSADVLVLHDGCQAVVPRATEAQQSRTYLPVITASVASLPASHGAATHHILDPASSRCLASLPGEHSQMTTLMPQMTLPQNHVVEEQPVSNQRSTASEQLHQRTATKRKAHEAACSVREPGNAVSSAAHARQLSSEPSPDSVPDSVEQDSCLNSPEPVDQGPDACHQSLRHTDTPLPQEHCQSPVSNHLTTRPPAEFEAFSGSGAHAESFTEMQNSWSHAQVQEQRRILRDIELRKLAKLPSKQAAILTSKKPQRVQHKGLQQTMLTSKFLNKMPDVGTLDKSGLHK